MFESILALVIFLLLVLLGVLFFRHEKGWFWQLRKGLALNDRVRMEDALKYFANCELEGDISSIKGTAAVLNVSEAEAGRIVTKLINQQLLMMDNSQFKLSPDGLSYGLRMIRAHRLYETYMAEYSGYKESEWHEKADFAEHKLTEKDIETIEKELNYPILDPHGDPIPNARGTMKSYDNVLSMNDLSNGQVGVIVHLEDEPKEVYSQLTAEGLYPGLEVHIIDKDSRKIKFWAGDDEHILSPILASNVHLSNVCDIQDREKKKKIPTKDLASYAQGAFCKIIGISPKISGTDRRRLMDLGFLPGTVVEKELVSSSGDPMAFRIRGTLIAIRKNQAEQIMASDYEEEPKKEVIL
ncbi:FeoA domain-containing protein [Spirochaeta cellobiosiphila]|uniref:metal-dependent transcriptional regulator n=1 Tax=Spirochaeta cellobiosiphila TaxID=504483 RepID=UPI0003F974FC|nr:FeoA domain-containing protein [Spirochaeta cellobiosiphila]